MNKTSFNILREWKKISKKYTGISIHCLMF